MIILATHMWEIFAKFRCIAGRSMFWYGLGSYAIIVACCRVLGPYVIYVLMFSMEIWLFISSAWKKVTPSSVFFLMITTQWQCSMCSGMMMTRSSNDGHAQALIILVVLINLNAATQAYMLGYFTLFCRLDHIWSKRWMFQTIAYIFHYLYIYIDASLCSTDFMFAL